MRRPHFITFDVFGTLFKLEEVASHEVMEEIIRRNRLSMNPEELAKLWWDRSYTVALDSFMTVREATRKALSLLLHEVGADDDPAHYSKQLLEGWMTTDVYPEVPEAISDLEGFTLGIVSNIDDDLLEVLMRRSGLRDFFEVRVTSEACRAYKPEPKIFEEALKRTNCRPREAMHLGDSPVDDVLGPKRVGMMAGWVNRRGEKLRGRIPKPDLVVRDLQEAANLISQSEPGP